MTQYAKPSSASKPVAPSSHDASPADGAKQARNVAQTDALLRTAPKPPADGGGAQAAAPDAHVVTFHYDDHDEAINVDSTPAQAPAQAIAPAQAQPHAPAQAPPQAHAPAQAPVHAAPIGAVAPAKGAVPATATPGKPDALAQLYVARDARAVELADKLVAALGTKSIHDVAMVLEGTPFLRDPALRQKFIEAYNDKRNQQIAKQKVKKGAPAPAKVNFANDVTSVDQIIDQHFTGDPAAYLKQLAQDGRSNPVWKVKLALGLVIPSKPYAPDELMHLVMEAPAELPAFKISLDTFWNEIKAPVAKKVKEPQYSRIEKFIKQQGADQALEHAKDEAHETDEHKEHALEKLKVEQRKEKWAADPRHGLGPEIRGAAHDSVVASQAAADTATQKSDHAAKQVPIKQAELDHAAIEYLAAMIVHTKGELNNMAPAAIEEIKEWTREHPTARLKAAAVGGLVFKAIQGNIEKPRDKNFLLQIIAGDVSGNVASSLKAKGFADDHLQVEEVVGAQAIVAREQAKQDKGKGKKHTNLRNTLSAMSPEGREQYLAEVSGMTCDRLEDSQFRDVALGKLRDHLMTVGVDAKDAAQIASLFRTTNAGSHYTQLRSLVLATDGSKYASDGFSDQAYQLVLELKDAEYYQVRSDESVLRALDATNKAAKIRALLGLDQKALASKSKLALEEAPDKQEKLVTQAKSDAELSTAHWAEQLGHELEKFAVSVPLLKDGRDRGRVLLIAQQAENSARHAVKEHKAHSEAIFMHDVKAKLSDDARKTLTTHYSKLATAIDSGTPITSDMVLDEVAKPTVMPLTGAKFYHHINVEHFTQTFEQCEGKELLEQWSNIQLFRDGLVTAKAQGTEKEFKSRFVLDARDEKKQLIKDAVGSAKAPAVLRKLREHLREAAESDDEFKKDLDDGGVNTLFHRERMGLRSSLEEADQRRKGRQEGFSLGPIHDLGGLTAPGSVDAQRQREVVGAGRTAYTDLGEVDEAEQDERYKKEHQADISKNEAGLQRTGADFTAARAKVRKYAELAITIAMMVLATAIAAGITAATFGGGAITLVGAAALWAKFGIMIAAKLAAVAATAVLKEYAGNKITGEEWNSRRVGTDMAVNSAGAVLGGIAGTGVEVDMMQASSAAIVELAKSAATAGAKAGSQQLTKFILARGDGDVGVMDSLLAVASAELTSIPAGEISVAISGEQSVVTDKTEIRGAYHGAGLSGASDPKGQVDQLIDHDQSAVDHAQATVDHDQLVVNHDQSVLDHLQHPHAAPHKAIEMADAHTQKAQFILGVSKHGGAVRLEDINAAKHHLELAHGQLELAKGGGHAPPSVAEMQSRLDAAQTKLDEAHTHLDEANEKLEQDRSLGERFEADEHSVLNKNIAAKPTDFLVEKSLDEALEELIDVRKERSKAVRDAEKTEQVAQIKEKQEKAAE